MPRGKPSPFHWGDKPDEFWDEFGERFNSLVPDYKGCLIWQWSVRPNGRYGVHLGRDAHRVSYVYHAGDITESLIASGFYQVCHIEKPGDRPHDKRCVNPDHLYLGNKKSNARDFYGKERKRRRARQTYSPKE